MSLPEVHFFTVRSKEQKLEKFIEKVTFHFQKKIPLLIKSPDQVSLEFLNRLLWSTPFEGFLPHSIDQDDLITLTFGSFQQKEVNSLFNLAISPEQLPTRYKTIYEFEDLTSPKKGEIFKQHFQFYRQAGCHLISVSP